LTLHKSQLHWDFYSAKTTFFVAMVIFTFVSAAFFSSVSKAFIS